MDRRCECLDKPIAVALTRGRGEHLSSSDQETRWIELARRGDLDAFEQLYRSNVRQVYGVCRRLLDNDHDAEDLTQAVFLRAWRRLGGFRGRSRFGTWLRRVAVNLVIDERKSSWRRQFDAESEEESDREAARSASPGAAMDLERAIALLPPGPRRVLVLHEVEGYTHAEMARLLGVTTGTTKTQLSRARRALQELLR